MKINTRVILSSWMLMTFVATAPAFAEEAVPATMPVEAKQTAEEIRSCARKNFPEETSVQTLTMIAHDRTGGQRTLRAQMFWRIDKKGFSNVMIRVFEPRDLSGSSYLVLERTERDDMFMYLPAVQRVRRIVGNMKSKPLWGTDLSYEDVKQLQGVALGGSLLRLDDAPVGQHDAYVIQTTYDDAEESAYGRVITHIDKSKCMPLQVDFFDVEGAPVKQLTVDPDTLAEIDGRWQMRNLVMKDLHAKTQTDIKVDDIKSDESISGRVFNSHTFHLGG